MARLMYLAPAIISLSLSLLGATPSLAQSRLDPCETVFTVSWQINPWLSLEPVTGTVKRPHAAIALSETILSEQKLNKQLPQNEAGKYLHQKAKELEGFDQRFADSAPLPVRPAEPILRRIQRSTRIGNNRVQLDFTMSTASVPNPDQIAFVKQGPDGVMGISAQKDALFFSQPGRPFDPLAKIVENENGTWSVEFGAKRSSEFKKIEGRSGRFQSAVYRDDVTYAMVWSQHSLNPSHLQNRGSVTILALNHSTGSIFTLSHEETYLDNYVGIDIDQSYFYIAKHNEVRIHERGKIRRSLANSGKAIYSNFKPMKEGIISFSVADGHLAVLERDYQLTLIDMLDGSKKFSKLMCEGSPGCKIDQVDLASRDEALLRIPSNDRWAITSFRFSTEQSSGLSVPDQITGLSVSADNGIIYLVTPNRIQMNLWSR